MRSSLHFFTPILVLCSVAAARGEVVTLVDPRGIAIDSSGNILVGCGGEMPEVLIFTRAGEKISALGGGKLADPRGIAVDAKGRILVADRGRNEVFLFGKDGELLRSAGGFAGPGSVAVGPVPLASAGAGAGAARSHPMGADAADPAVRVFVADTGHSRIAVLDTDLEKVLFSIEAVAAGGDVRSALKEPAAVAVAGGRLAISDSGNHRVLTLPAPREGGGLLSASVVSVPDMEPGAAALSEAGRLYVVDRGAVRGFGPDGKPSGLFRAAAVRMWYEPRGIALDASGGVLTVDGSTRRVLATSADLFDAEPSLQLDPRDPSTAVIEWKTLSSRPGIVRYGPTEDCEQELRDETPTVSHRAVLKGLDPAKRYFFHTSDPVEAIPPTTPARLDLALETQRTSYRLLSRGNFSGEYPFATLPRAGTTDWASLPVIVLVYERVTFPPDPDGKKPPDRVLDADDIATLESEMETYRAWAWRHSHAKLNLDYTYVRVSEPREHGLLGDLTPAVVRDIEEGLRAQGKDIDGYWNVIVIGTHGWYANYLAGPVAGTPHELGSCYTGFGHGTNRGWWWFPTHEHGHLIHSMVMCSSAGAFAFPDAPWTLQGKFGEDFSFLAYNYRQFPARGWLCLKRTAIRTSLDLNGNGVPDADPAVPIDEKRFGWSPSMGGDCLARIMAGVRSPGFPGETDADFDGKVHRLNEGELYWVDRKAPRSAPALDGKIADGEWKEFYSLPNITTPAELRDVKARLYLGWDDGVYYFAVQSSRRVNASLDLDAANDGWFHGRDNLRFSVRPEDKAPGAGADGAIWDFLGDKMNVHDGQLWYREAYKTGDITAASGEEGGWFVLELAVPARPEIRIAPSSGAKFAVRVTISADPPDAVPARGFLDGEDFVHDITCVER